METRNEGTAMHSHSQLRCWISKVQAIPRNSTVKKTEEELFHSLIIYCFVDASLESV